MEPGLRVDANREGPLACHGSAPHCPSHLARIVVDRGEPRCESERYRAKRTRPHGSCAELSLVLLRSEVGIGRVPTLLHFKKSLSGVLSLEHRILPLLSVIHVCPAPASLESHLAAQRPPCHLRSSIGMCHVQGLLKACGWGHELVMVHPDTGCQSHHL